MEAFSGMRLEDGWSSVFQLQKQGVMLAGHQKDDATEGCRHCPRDHLDGKIHHLEAIKELPAVFLEGFRYRAKAS